jgi:uncharacterized membrane protein
VYRSLVDVTFFLSFVECIAEYKPRSLGFELMDLTQLIQLISRWLHIVPAIAMAGGILFMRIALVPAEQESGVSDSFRSAIRRRWSKVVMISILLLLVSGLYNAAVKSIDYELSSVYLAMMTAKIALSLAVFFLASLLAGRSERAKRFRQREAYWLNVISIMMLAIVLLAGAMKMSNAPLKPKKNSMVTTAVLACDHPDVQALILGGWN